MSVERNILVDLLRGQGAHIDPVGVFEDLSVQAAGTKIDSCPHTIWQILWHMDYWQDFELETLRGAAPAQPLQGSESWPSAKGPAGEADLESDLERFRSGLNAFQALLKDPAFYLDSEAVPEKQQTNRQLILGIIAHNSYHSGQAALIRQMLGAWPPSSGGDA